MNTSAHLSRNGSSHAFDVSTEIRNNMYNSIEQQYNGMITSLKIKLIRISKNYGSCCGYRNDYKFKMMGQCHGPKFN